MPPNATHPCDFFILFMQQGEGCAVGTSCLGGKRCTHIIQDFRRDWIKHNFSGYSTLSLVFSLSLDPALHNASHFNDFINNHRGQSFSNQKSLYAPHGHRIRSLHRLLLRLMPQIFLYFEDSLSRNAPVPERSINFSVSCRHFR